MKDNDEMMQELYEKNKKQMDELYSNPLQDDEVEQLHTLLQRAKRDDRFKDKLKGIDLWFISSEAIRISCDRIQEKLEKLNIE